MGVGRTVGSSHNSILFLFRSVLLIRTIALALFVLGPLVGSVDVDGDGTPDVPVVLVARSAVKDVSPGATIHPSGGLTDIVEYASVRDRTYLAGANNSGFTSNDGRIVLRFSSRLRC